MSIIFCALMLCLADALADPELLFNLGVHATSVYDSDADIGECLDSIVELLVCCCNANTWSCNLHYMMTLMHVCGIRR